MTDAGLKQLFHPYDTNSCEGFMWLVASMTPKTKHLCRSINYQARCALAVGIKSLGYKCYYERLLSKLNIEMGGLLTKSMGQKDGSLARKRDYRNRPDIKKKKAAKRIENDRI